MATTITTDPGTDLEDVLREFDDVVEELKAPCRSSSGATQHLLEEGIRGASCDYYSISGDSGVEDSDYCSEASLGNSLNTSQEELRPAGISLTAKARLGDTVDLQSFIDSLDRELSEM
ncbi:regulator of cell cycle RGCC-like [Gadus macrocephalus]|uniref:regulator of cell cycle RGCC-like n=1 Tax=Gadus macrocephalus TaxID=80720 RepID=UPI0028CB6341|nr:regulator of cell cycle RGCC-like [Gadus macrocephalus]